jgi:hypothetical protein
VFMIKEFRKKGFKEIKKLMEKLEKKKECLDRQEDLLILEKERNLALERALAEEKVKVEKLVVDLSLANDSKERMSKETTLINESLASLKATHSDLQESFSCLTTVVSQNPLVSSDRQHEAPGGSRDCWWAPVPQSTAQDPAHDLASGLLGVPLDLIPNQQGVEVISVSFLHA